MLKLKLYDNSYVHKLVNGAMTVAVTTAEAADKHNT